MEIPLDTYLTRINTMIVEALPAYRSTPDKQVGNAGPKWFAVKLDGMTKDGGARQGVQKYIIKWEIMLVHGAASLGNKGVMRAWMYDDIATIMSYFDTHDNLLTTAQINPDDYIGGFRSGTLQFNFLDEGNFGGGRNEGDERATRYSLQFRHDEILASQQV